MLKNWTHSQICLAPDGADGGGVTPPAPVTPPVGPWYQGKVQDAEVVGHWQNRGWGQKSAEEIAIEATRAHREAEKLIGAPANQIIRLPANPTDADGMKQVWQRLGMPADAKEYDFSGVKHVDDKEPDPKLVETLRTTAHGANLTKDAALAVAKGVIKYQDDVRSAEVAEKQAALALERDALAKNWGINAVANKLVAQGAVKALGLDPDLVNSLEGVLGYAKVMEMFRNIGAKIGEDKFVGGGNPGGNNVMTREQAIARRGELMRDPEWTKSYLNGDSQKAREMQAITSIIVGQTA